MIDYIRNNFYNLISTFIGLLGLLLAIIFYIKSTKVKKPYYSILSFNLFNKELQNIENIEIKYFDENIKNLTVTKIAIWNGGKATIDKTDIPSNSRLIIKSNNNVVIYGAEIIFVNDESNQLRLNYNKEKNELLVDFDYLDYNQGGIIRILHSGESSKDIILSGKIKGVGNYINIPDPVFIEKNVNKTDFKMSIITFFIIILGCLYGSISINAIGWKIFLLIMFFVFSYFIIKNIKLPRFPDDLNTKFND